MGYYDNNSANNSGSQGGWGTRQVPGQPPPQQPPPQQAPPAQRPPPPWQPRDRAGAFPTPQPGQVTFAPQPPAGAPPDAFDPSAGLRGAPPPPGWNLPQALPSIYGAGYNANGTVGPGAGYYGAAPSQLNFETRSGRGHF